MMDHICIRVKDLAASRRFYAGALSGLGYMVLHDFPEWIGMGDGGKAHLWLVGEAPHTSGLHLAFACNDRVTVDAFHRDGLAAGGRDNGEPGLRPQYHANYYGAFLLDPDGNNSEAVYHGGR